MMKKLLSILLAAVMGAASVGAINLKDVIVYINPGHGGYDANDLPLQIYPFASGDTAGAWESTSNLYKGLHLKYILDSLGVQTKMWRVKNTTADDRALSSIANEANNWCADDFFSIHSNVVMDHTCRDDHCSSLMFTIISFYSEHIFFFRNRFNFFKFEFHT